MVVRKMPKRRTEFMSSSSSSDGEGDDSQGSQVSIDVPKKKKTLGNTSGSRKRVRGDSPEESSITPGTVTSTLRQKQSEVEIIVKNELEESEDSPPPRNRSRSRSAAAQQSTPKVRRSKRPSKAPSSKDPSQPPSKDPSQRPPAKRAPRRQLPEKYFGGCLVLGKIDEYPHWPGMIRKATANEDRHPDFTCNQNGKTWFFIQSFTKPTILDWRIAKDMELFNPAKEHPCDHQVPSVVADYQKAIRIAKGAANFAVETRLAKFTLPRNVEIDDLLREIDGENNGQHSLDDSGSGAPLESGVMNSSIGVSQNDYVAQEDVDDPPAPAPLVRSKKTSISDVVASLKKQSEFMKRKDREKEESIKALQRDNLSLAAELQNSKATNRVLQLALESRDESKMESLETKLKDKEKLIAELRTKFKDISKEKRKLEEEMGKMESEVESLKNLFDEEGPGA